jgi:hypothetical protein
LWGVRGKYEGGVVGKREVLNEGFEKEGGVKLRGGR